MGGVHCCYGATGTPGQPWALGIHPSPLAPDFHRLLGERFPVSPFRRPFKTCETFYV